MPAERCADVIRECGERGVRAVVVISAGLTGTADGREVLDAVRRYGMRMVGPNCLGVATTEPGHSLNATFPRDPIPVREVGVVTQSGGVETTRIAVLYLESFGNPAKFGVPRTVDDISPAA